MNEERYMPNYRPQRREREDHADGVGGLLPLLKGRIPLIFVDTTDDERFDRELRMAMKTLWGEARAREMEVREYVPGLGGFSFRDKTWRKEEGADEEGADWGGTEGLKRFLFGEDYEPDTILVVRGGTAVFEWIPESVAWFRTVLGNAMEDRSLAGRGGDGLGGGTGRFRYLVVVGPVGQIPASLVPYSSRVELAPPDARGIGRLYEEARAEAAGMAPSRSGTKPGGVTAEEVARWLKGFGETEIRMVLRYALAVPRTMKTRIAEAKRDLVERTGFLKLVDGGKGVRGGGPDGGGAGFAGLKAVEAHLRQAGETAKLDDDTLEALEGHGTKGILLVGMPGCGKSMVAKAAGNLLGCPLIQLDVGRLLGKYVGESEAHLRQALSIADRAAPCVLWIDELEKAFSGLDSSDGTALRLFGSFLTWMQEKRTQVYVIATANDLAKIPLEFKRKGRFDEIFSILLPDTAEREAIFKYHLQKVAKAPKWGRVLEAWTKDDDSGLAAAARRLARESAYKTGNEDDGRGFSGADIAGCVREATVKALTAESLPEDAAAFVEEVVRAVAAVKQGRTTQRDIMQGVEKRRADGASTNAYDEMVRQLKNGGFRPATG